MPYRPGWVFQYSTAILPAAIHQMPEQLERDAVEFFGHAYMPQAGDVVLDVGAGLGTEVLPFSRMVGPTGKVYALEAHPDS